VSRKSKKPKKKKGKKLMSTQQTPPAGNAPWVAALAAQAEANENAED